MREDLVSSPKEALAGWGGVEWGRAKKGGVISECLGNRLNSSLTAALVKLGFCSQ